MHNVNEWKQPLKDFLAKYIFKNTYDWLNDWYIGWSQLKRF